MARRRDKRNSGLPPYVYKTRRGWIYRPYLGRGGGKTLWGTDILLAPKAASQSEAVLAYHRMAAGKNSKKTLSWMLEQYHGSPKYQKLMPRTRAEYEIYQRKLISYPARGGTLGDATLEGFTRRTIRDYLDRYPAPVAANRHVQYLRAAWKWAAQRYDIPDNPCIGVDLNDQEPRDRYVTPEEMRAAKAMASGYLPIIIELAYLCRARRSEITSLQKDDVLQEGLRLRRLKGSEGEITAWTPRLRAAVDAALDWNPAAPGPWLLHDKHGSPIKKNALDSAWQRLMKKWVDAGGERFTLHDLKAAGYSDQESQWAGHKSARMHAVYSRKLRVVEPPA